MSGNRPTGPRRTVRAARISAELTQADLARLSDCSVDYIRLLERGYTPRSPRRARAYRHVLATLQMLGHPVEQEGALDDRKAGGGL